MVQTTRVRRISEDLRGTSHGEAEKVVKKIDTEVITEEAIHALPGLSKGGIYSIVNPSPETLTKFFGEYSMGSKAYRTQGGEDALFCEVARVLHEYGFIHPRPKNNTPSTSYVARRNVMRS